MSLYDEWLAEKGHRIALDTGPKLIVQGKGQFCRNCEFMRTHMYSDRYNYCALKKSKHTPCGMGKTKRLSWCQWWKPEPNESANAAFGPGGEG